MVVISLFYYIAVCVWHGCYLLFYVRVLLCVVLTLNRSFYSVNTWVHPVSVLILRPIINRDTNSVVTDCETEKNKTTATYELGQPSHCQRGRLPMPRSIQCVWKCFFGTMLIMPKPANGKPGFFSFFVREIWPILMSEKYKNAHNLREKRIKPGFPFVCTCGSNTTLKFQIETLKI